MPPMFAEHAASRMTAAQDRTVKIGWHGAPTMEEVRLNLPLRPEIIEHIRWVTAMSSTLLCFDLPSILLASPKKVEEPFGVFARKMLCKLCSRSARPNDNGRSVRTFHHSLRNDFALTSSDVRIDRTGVAARGE